MARPQEYRRTAWLTVTLEAEEKARIALAALASGHTMSSWARWAMVKALPKRAAGAAPENVVSSPPQSGDPT
jgi:hypothetical protein